MRIVIDLQGAQTGSRYRGIGRYSLSLAQAIVKQAVAHEVFIVLNSRLHESIDELFQVFSGLIPRENIRIFDVPVPLAEADPSNVGRSRVAEKIREDFIQRIDPDVVLITSLFEGVGDDAVSSVGAFCNGGNTAVVLYDLIPLLNPAAYLSTDAHRNFYYQRIQYLKNAGLLLAISDYSRREAIESLGISPSKIVSISTAMDEKFQVCSQGRIEPELLRRLGISRKMVMYAPGGFDPRKNVENLIQAYSLLVSGVRSEHQLVIVSKLTAVHRSYLEQVRISMGLAEDELVLTDYVKDEDLRRLYSEAALFVFPSKHEGFGLPVLEAMACGAPAIGSNTTSIPEVIGCEDALFDPDSAVAIAEKMQRVLSDVSFRERLREHGLKQAKKFSWDDCAKRAINALENLKSLTDSSVLSNDPGPLLKAIVEVPETKDMREEELAEIAECIAFNLPSERSRELLLDISVIVCTDAKSGIQRVVRSLLLELLAAPPDNVSVRPIYFDAGCYRYANNFSGKIAGCSALKEEDEIVEFHQNDIYLALDLNAHLASLAHPYHQALRRRGVQLYFIVYDLLLIQHPEWWVKGISHIFETWLRNICEVASGLFCISASVADEVREWIGQNPPKRQILPRIHSFHLGADVENSAPTRGIPDNASDVLRELAKRTTFLTVGTIEPRKGHAQILAAFELLWQRGADVNLVIVGKNGWLLDRLVEKIRLHAELERRLFWLEGISDEYLEKIYSSSDCLIAASEGEGFGLPLIEAAQHKKSLIVRDIPVFREVAQNHAFYFSGKTAEDLATAIADWLQLHQQGLAPSSENMPWLTWKQSADLLKEKLFRGNSFT